jgi:hypothetical protein
MRSVILLLLGWSTFLVAWIFSRYTERHISKSGFDKRGEVLAVILVIAWVYFLLGLWLYPVLIEHP